MKIELDVLVMRETANGENYWVAQCLQHDVVAQAKTLNELKANLSHVLICHIMLSIEKKIEPFSNLKAAPEMYWEQFNNHHSEFQSRFPLAGDLIPEKFKAALKNCLPRGEALMRFAESV